MFVVIIYNFIRNVGISCSLNIYYIYLSHIEHLVKSNLSVGLIIMFVWCLAGLAQLFDWKGYKQGEQCRREMRISQPSATRQIADKSGIISTQADIPIRKGILLCS